MSVDSEGGLFGFFFADALPSSTTVQVARLSRPEFMVEIEAFAIV